MHEPIRQYSALAQLDVVAVNTMNVTCLLLGLRANESLVIGRGTARYCKMLNRHKESLRLSLVHQSTEERNKCLTMPVEYGAAIARCSIPNAGD